MPAALRLAVAFGSVSEYNYEEKRRSVTMPELPTDDATQFGARLVARWCSAASCNADRRTDFQRHRPTVAGLIQGRLG
jgi:hypothetical protein